MTRRASRPRAYAPDPAAPGRACDMPACGAPGDYRAPKSKKDLREYWWFCLEHVRAYNASWDYYKGMSPAQIEIELRRDTAWQRPTWPLGRLGANSVAEDDLLRDPLRVLMQGERRRGRNERGRDRRAEQAPAELRESLATLGLAWPVTLPAVKSRYKELAKANHPDANGGDRAAEERFKTINLAYAALRSWLARDPALAATG
ncbi:MAG: J domain-containing protein [Pseudomonadota bacterium]|nr:J domain-containing protein [Pseudomonadota bacterium]